jgi:hypothetical protein
MNDHNNKTALNSEAKEASVESDSLKLAGEAAAKVLAKLSVQLERAKKIDKILSEILVFREKKWPLHIQALCEKEAAFLKELREEGHSAIEAIEEVFRDSKKQGEDVIFELPSRLETLAKSASLEINEKSAHPNYLFARDGFIEVKIDDRKRTATISTRAGRLASLPADASAIIENVAKESDRIFHHEYQGEKFLADLRTAYLAKTKADKAEDGSPVAVRQLFAEIQKKQRDYKLDAFIVDLTHLVEKGPASTDGYRFELQQSKDTDEGVLLLGASSQGMVNLFIFRK